MNITRIKPQTLAAGWMTFLVILLFIFGLPPLAARLIALPGEAVRLRILDGEKVSEEEAAKLEHTRLLVSPWFSLNDNFNDLALVATERAYNAQEQMFDRYREAEKWQKEALKISPADAYGWYRLAYLYYVMDGGPSSRVAEAWRQSMASAPYEPRLAVPRLQMAMSLGSFLGDDTRYSVESLIRSVWYDDPDFLAQLAHQSFYVSLVEQALRNDEESLQEFQFKISAMR